jgi:hypothetical protein
MLALSDSQINFFYRAFQIEHPADHGRFEQIEFKRVIIEDEVCIIRIALKIGG